MTSPTNQFGGEGGRSQMDRIKLKIQIALLGM